jgi:hypothetical protein
MPTGEDRFKYTLMQAFVLFGPGKRRIETIAFKYIEESFTNNSNCLAE